ncbi:hypothetical protein TWF718_003595 [Orbilia javanica]|uniref:Peptidase S8/S53 domain-containing protein n=1 Tax=Orbilia javanica TaxID=47235 RepID=A0AAN8MRA1_9PEZI
MLVVPVGNGAPVSDPIPKFDIATGGWHPTRPDFMALPIFQGRDQNSAVDVYPAKFGPSKRFQGRMVVVGGYDPDTGLISHSWADYVRVAAPAVFVNVAALYINGQPAIQYGGYLPKPTKLQQELQLEISEGTSFACPMVTGIIATLLGAGVPVTEVIPYLYSKAYSRTKGGPNVVYNGIKIGQRPRSSRPKWYPQSLFARTEPVKTILRNAQKTLYTYFKRETAPTPAAVLAH